MLHLWLRDETKPGEKRAALSPQDAKALRDQGIQVTVESSDTRVFPDHDYAQAGCRIEANGSWKSAPTDAFVLGLKELPESDEPLKHRHIYFAHAYKNQQGWKDVLSRFVKGNGTLFDLEYLTEPTGRRVAAFGYWAGYAGAAVGADLWAHSVLFPEIPYAALRSYPSRAELLKAFAPRLQEAISAHGKAPSSMIIGALGRCGKGAAEFLKQAGLAEITAWDKDETSMGGPFSEILKHDLFINCVLLQGEIRPFLSKEMLDQSRKLRVISDVSCDPTNPHNPIPVYERTTTFQSPAIRLKSDLWLTAIDHLPSLLPKESSEDFSSQLLPHLCQLQNGSPIWEAAEKLFHSTCARGSLYDH